MWIVGSNILLVTAVVFCIHKTHQMLEDELKMFLYLQVVHTVCVCVYGFPPRVKGMIVAQKVQHISNYAISCQSTSITVETCWRLAQKYILVDLNI